MSDQQVSIILRSFNEGWALRDTLPALQAQDYVNWELIVIDSGSNDGSVDLIRQAKPKHFIQILPQYYRPGWTLNSGMQLARSEIAIFLNADATPIGPTWLRSLVDALLEQNVAAVFGRQVPRRDCRSVFASDYARCFKPGLKTVRCDHFFSMVSSGLRRDVWSRRGFLESMQYSEDEEYARWCRKQGLHVSYCPSSVVAHSHNYTFRQAYKRSFGEAWALVNMKIGSPTQPRQTRHLALGWLNDVRRDLGFCLQTGRLLEWTHSCFIRWAQRLGRRDGERVGTAIQLKANEA